MVASCPLRAQTVEAYHPFDCNYKTPVELKTVLDEILPKDDGKTRVLVDAEQDKILVKGSDDTLKMARRIIRALDRPPVGSNRQSTGAREGFSNRNRARTPDVSLHPLQSIAQPRHHATTSSMNTRRVVSGGNPTSRFFRLKSDPALLKSRLRRAFSERVSVEPKHGLDQIVQFHLTDGRAIEFEFNQRRQGVLISTDAALIPQAQRLISALDGLRGQVRQRTAVVSIQRTDSTRLRRAIHAYLGDQDGHRVQPPVVDSNPAKPLPSDSSKRRISKTSGIGLVNYIFQDAETKPTENIVTPPGRPGGLDIDVEVETLDDLDVIILRGSDRDVSKLTEIIQELERLSKETLPEVRVVQLKHAQSESVSQIVESVREDLTGRRQGRVSLTPLVKPNAILLIGWGDAIETTVDLIQRLDSPVAPESQFQVFRIKHAPVSIISNAISQFLSDRPGLGPKVEALADSRSNSLIVYAAPRDMAEVSRLVESMDVAKGERINRARVFMIKNALATDLVETLQTAISASAGQTSGVGGGILELMTIDSEGERLVKSGILQDIKITANPRNNSLIVSGPSESIPLIAALIRELDSPGAVAQIKVFRIINGDASSLVQMLRSLVPSETGSAGGPRLPASQGETSLVPLRFSVDTRTNSIIATGSSGDLEIIEALLIRLDEKDLAERKNEVYRLKNSPALDVAAAINEFLRSERIVNQVAPGAGSPFEQIEREVVVVPEPVRNSLIISATPRYFEEIRRLIVQLDEAPSQVMIQVLIAEIQLNSAQEFGVELGLQDSILFDRSLLGDLVTTTNTTQTSTPAGIVTSTEEIIQAATNEPGFLFNNRLLGNSGSTQALQGANQIGSQGLSHFSVGRMNNELGFGGLVLSASSESVSVLIRALQDSRRLDVLSRPQVRTLDNQRAYIQVGQRVPRITSTNITDGGLQTNSVTLEDVGLILGVTPRVSPDGTVVMEIDAEKSSLGPEQEGIPISVSVDGNVVRAPRINTTLAQTTVSAASGETIILGGLITKEDSTITRRVPYLSDIPLLGDVFRFDSQINRRNELLIILTPHVIRDSFDSERINQIEMARVSWCAADAYDIHGDLGMSGIQSPLNDDGVEVIYPDLNPRGTSRPAPTPSDFDDPSSELNSQSLNSSNRSHSSVSDADLFESPPMRRPSFIPGGQE